MIIDENIRRRLLVYQKNEITEHYIYSSLAKTLNPENRHVLEQMAEEELRHYYIWRKHTRQDIAPDRRTIRVFYVVSRLFGFTFGAKLLERREQRYQQCYEQLSGIIPEAETIRQEECGHEAALLDMLNERKLHYSGSIILGLNDALVELTAALAGLTFALQDTRLVALTGLITGVAAAMSMAVSEYLSTESEETKKIPLRASLYTGSAYLVTVLILVAPYLLLDNPFVALALAFFSALAIIALFNFYLSVAKGQSFKRRFFKMAGLSLGVAAVSFLFGIVVRTFFGADV